MEVTLEEKGNTARIMTVTVPQETYMQQLDNRLRQLSRTLRLKGFRVGHVPMKIVRQHHLVEAQEKVASSLVESSLKEALQMKQLQPVVNPRIVLETLGEDTPMKYRAEFDIFPVLSEDQIKQLKLTDLQSEIGEAEIDIGAQRLREHHATTQPVTRALAMGDDAELLAERAEGDEAVPELSEDSQKITLSLVPDSPMEAMYPQLEGMNEGEEKQFQVDFPVKEGHPLSGQTWQFRVRILQVLEKTLPELENPEFLMQFQCTDLEGLRTMVRRHLEDRRDELVQQNCKQQLMEGLLNTIKPPLEIPSSLQEWCLEVRMREAGMEQADPEAPEAGPLREAAQADATQITIYRALLDLSQVEATEEDQQKTQSAYISQYRDANVGREQIRRDPQTRDYLEREAIWSALVRWAMQRAQVTEQKISLEQLQEGRS